jgi:arylsulfatase A-like enzyme
MQLSRRELLLSAAAWPALGAKQQAPRPNVVLILADGIGAWMLGINGNQDIRTPNLDLLARTGARFVRSLACSPASSPSRATLLTGRAPRRHGIQDALGPGSATPAAFAGQRLLPDMLAGVGYRCGYAGRWDLGSAEKAPPSFSFWQTQSSTLQASTASALEFLDQQKAGQPFFLTLGYWLPEDPPSKYREMYAASRFESIGWERQAPNAARGKEAFVDVVGSLRQAAAAVTAVDDQIPPLLKKLDERGLRDDTLVIFTATHGSLLGRHGLWDGAHGSEPANMFEEVVAVPMIWSWPRRIPPEALRPELVSAYDLVPTLCELLRAPVPAPGPGRSYLPAVLNHPFPKKQPWRNLVFGEFLDAEMARDKRYKMILRGGGRGPNELYDEIVDARERVNRYDNPQFLSVRDALTAELDAWRKRAENRKPELGVPSPG